MTTHLTAPTPLGTPALDDLRSALTGSLTAAGDAGWDTARLAWNRLVDQHPLAVVHAADAADVAATVRWAAAHGVPLSAQPNGHGASRSLDGAVLVRTSALDDIWVDAGARVARVGAGVKWGDLQVALDGTGLTGLVGSNPDVTVVGYCLGGGLSWFSRAFGSGAGAVRSFEVVDATGAHRWVSDESPDDADLLWALRGGGGDFALVTAVELDLFPAPQIYGGMLAFPAAAAPAVFRAFTAVTATAPEELSTWVSVLHLPDAPFIPEPLRGASLAVVLATYLGDPAEAERLLAPVRAAGPVLRDTFRPLQPGEVGLLAEEPVDPSPAVLAGTRLHTFDDAAIDAVLDLAGEPGRSPLMQVQVRHVGGALAREALPGAAGAAAEPFLLTGMAMVPVPELAPLVTAALDHLFTVVEPWSAGTAPLTFLDRDDAIDRCYPAATIERLRAVKAAVDSSGLFRSNRPVAAGVR
ncbi:FAD-binding oxidoreductase [Cellulomonas hominis]|uniref:FAD-binding oxidoreductase n=1 Tax=Cellulomonas hominis TaxID=156981 RepID=UPI001B94E63D|nr:FAD-binding protein [Cellulomonas hominis]VTR75358.1 Mitomycin radical oxidase [Cellulomonas hominis]